MPSEFFSIAICTLRESNSSQVKQEWQTPSSIVGLDALPAAAAVEASAGATLQPKTQDRGSWLCTCLQITGLEHQKGLTCSLLIGRIWSCARMRCYWADTHLSSWASLLLSALIACMPRAHEV